MISEQSLNLTLIFSKIPKSNSSEHHRPVYHREKPKLIYKERFNEIIKSLTDKNQTRRKNHDDRPVIYDNKVRYLHLAQGSTD